MIDREAKIESINVQKICTTLGIYHRCSGPTCQTLFIKVMNVQHVKEQI